MCSKSSLAVCVAATAFAHHALAADTPAAPACAQYEKTLTRAELSFKNVPVCARINPELWGLRKELAEHGIGFTATCGGGAVTLFSDGFEGSGWSFANVSGTTGYWTLGASSTHPSASPHGGTKLAAFNSYTCAAGLMAILST